MALAALCEDDDWGRTWSRVVQHRFSGPGELAGHSVGNLLIVALWELAADDPVNGLDWVGRLLKASGRVLPMATVPARHLGHGVRRGRQHPHRARPGRGRDDHRSHPRRHPVPRKPHPPVRRPSPRSTTRTGWCWARGPGSPASSRTCWCPSWQRRSHRTSARRVVVLNLEPQPGETSGFAPTRTWRCWRGQAPDLRIDVVRGRPVVGCRRRRPAERPLHALGAEVVCADVRGRRTAAPPRPGAAGRGLGLGPVRPTAATDHGRSERMPRMAMTAQVKDELARLTVTKPCCRKAEVSALLRFAGGLHLVSGHIVLEAELDTGVAARRLRKDISEVYGHSSDARRARRRRPAQGHPLCRAGRQGRRLAGPADRSGRRTRSPGARTSAAGGVRRHLRRRVGLARSLPGARVAHRAGTVVGPRDHLSRAGGGSGAGGRRTTPGHRRPRLARSAASTGW